jgi:acetyltransferase-like isoleucine patch superfamily enzyme
MRASLATALGLVRRGRFLLWVARARARLRWSGLRLDLEVGDGVAFVKPPFVLMGVEPANGAEGVARVRIGAGVRFGPGVIIEIEPGRDSLLEIGDSSRIGANVHIHLRGGAVRIGPRNEIRDGCVLKTTGGEILLGDRCFISYGCVLHATERVEMEDKVAIGERVTLVDSGHDTDGSDRDWAEQPVPTAPVLVGRNTLVFANAVITMGARIGPNSQVGAFALVRGEHPAGSLLAGVPAKAVRELGAEHRQ